MPSKTIERVLFEGVPMYVSDLLVQATLTMAEGGGIARPGPVREPPGGVVLRAETLRRARDDERLCEGPIYPDRSEPNGVPHPGGREHARHAATARHGVLTGRDQGHCGRRVHGSEV